MNTQKVMENAMKNTHFASQDGSEVPQDGPKIVPRALLAALGRSWAALGLFLAALGRSWLALGTTWADLGASWGDLRAILGDLGAILSDLGAIKGAQEEAIPARGRRSDGHGWPPLETF